jgi:hypothetical protein
MSKLKFPENTTSALDCADWMELATLVSPERRCSIAAVERNLKRLSTYDSTNAMQQAASIENACAEVLGEIKRRAKAAQSAYPFSLDDSSIALSGDVREFVPYIFCLCLSWFGWKAKKGKKVFPRRMFEDLSKHAAQAFVGGRALRFGAPRRDLPANFKKALSSMASAIGEGEPRDIAESVKAQDDTLDLIAWRDFPDEHEGKLFLVGQCASGWNWESKKRELDVEAFFDQWFTQRPPSLLRGGMRVGIFIPHRVPRPKWVPITRTAGIIFDRCRIAYWSQRSPEFKNQKQYSEWSKKTLATVRHR